MAQVLFVSKPVAPPFRDGTKCLVRDVATRLRHVTPVIMSTPEAPPLAGVNLARVYRGPGRFSPEFTQNLRGAAWVLARARAELLHFVFAPNARTSRVGRWLCRLKRRRAVQTIASAPRSFRDIDELLFGDVIVAQSQWTADRVLSEYQRKGLKPPDVRVILPPFASDLARSPEQARAARAELGIAAGAPLYVYPGDLEVSSGAATAVRIAARLAETRPDARVVLAYRKKTERAERCAEELRARAPARTMSVVDVPDVLSLIAAADAVIFPVDDLWGKIDLPIVLLEALALGVPVLAYAHGPLLELDGAALVPSLDADEWVTALAALTPRTAAGARAPVLERCHADVVARSYEALYLELLARS
jgi:glycosyltransferase involved in cell wall biosynthesis